MSTDSQRTKCRRNIAENYNGLRRVHERYRQTDERQHTSERERSLTRKKFKKGISFVFKSIVTALLFNSQFNTAVKQQLNNKLKF